jgi:dienelactone hydrolase
VQSDNATELQVKPTTNYSATPKLRNVRFENVHAVAECAGDWWRNPGGGLGNCGDNSSGKIAPQRIAPGVFWGLPDSVMRGISLHNVTVQTTPRAPWRCSALDAASLSTSAVVPPFACAEDGALEQRIRELEAVAAAALPGNLTNCSACTFEMQCEAADDPGDCHWCAMPPGHGGKSYCAANGTICRRGGRLKSDDRKVPQVSQPRSAEVADLMSATIQLPVCADHSSLHNFPDSDGRCESEIKTADDWLKRRSDILVGFKAVAGAIPSREHQPALDVQITHTIYLPNGVRRHNLTYVAAANATLRVPAFLYVPATATSDQRAPCVLASHPTSTLGKEYASIRAPPLNYAEELAARGYVVIQPDYPSMGGLRDYDFTKAEADGWASGTARAVFDNMRAIDVMTQLNFTEIEKLAAIGHSLGGHNTLFTSVVDERVKVVVSSCGWTPWRYYITEDRPLKSTWAIPKYMPRITSVFKDVTQTIPFDFEELVAAIAPRAFFSNSPYTDFNFNVSGVWATVPKVRTIWELLGATDALHFEYPAGGCMSEAGGHDCGHDFPAGTRFEAYDFIDRQLGLHMMRGRASAES